MKQCECCGELFVPETIQLPEPKGALQAVCQIVGSTIYSNVCDAKECQAYAQHQCDEFDQMRKGEY